MQTWGQLRLNASNYNYLIKLQLQLLHFFTLNKYNSIITTDKNSNTEISRFCSKFCHEEAAYQLQMVEQQLPCARKLQRQSKWQLFTFWKYYTLKWSNQLQLQIQLLWEAFNYQMQSKLHCKLQLSITLRFD